MSQLDALAEALGSSVEEARSFAREVRSNFPAAPSYAQIIVAVRKHPGGRPSVAQVVADIRAFTEEDLPPTPARRDGRFGGPAGRSGRGSGRPGRGAPSGPRQRGPVKTG